MQISYFNKTVNALEKTSAPQDWFGIPTRRVYDDDRFLSFFKRLWRGIRYNFERLVDLY